MPLNINELTSELEIWMNNKNNYTSITDSMNELAALYDRYAQKALDLSGDGPDKVNKNALSSLLQGITLDETAQTAAHTMEQAIIAYWTGAVFKTAIPPPGANSELSALVTTPPVPGGIKEGLEAVFEDKTPNRPGDEEQIIRKKAGDIARVLDGETKKVQVTCSGVNPSGSPVIVSGSIT